MKPVTAQEYAKCYGTFIADLVIVAKVLPAINTWLKTTLPDVSTMYTLNKSVFSVYRATITSFPRPIFDAGRFGGKSAPSRSDFVKSREIILAWSAISLDLKNALTCAEVSPSVITKIRSTFSMQRPKTFK